MTNDNNQKDGDTSQAQSNNRSPEMQARIEEFHRNIGKALCDNLNRAVLAKPQRNLQLIANNQEQGPQEHRTFEAMIEQLDRELEESVPAQFNQTEESFFAPKLKIVRSD